MTSFPDLSRRRGSRHPHVEQPRLHQSAPDVLHWQVEPPGVALQGDEPVPAVEARSFLVQRVHYYRGRSYPGRCLDCNDQRVEEQYLPQPFVRDALVA